MKKKMNVGIVVTLMAAIGTFGVIDSLQAAPDGSQRLRGMEGRAFLVEGFILDEDGNVVGENPPGGSYCYIFNPGGEWDDQRFPVTGTWEQQSVGAATPYTATASFLFPFGFVELFQEGHVTPAKGKGVLQLEATTEIYLEPFGLVQVLLTIGHEIDANDCPPPFPDPE